jgi:hypothetical protein
MSKDPMIPGTHPTHILKKFEGHPPSGPKTNGASVVSLPTRELQEEPETQNRPEVGNLLRKIVLRPSEWEGIPVPPRRWAR